MIDLVLAGIIGVSALLGVLRGMVAVLASLLAWVLAGWAAFQYGGSVAVVLAEGGTPGASDLFGGYALCFIGVMLVVGLTGWVVGQMVKAMGLSALDRSLGLALGLLRGGLMACVLVLLMAFTPLTQEPAWRQSRLLPVLVPAAQWLSGWLPAWSAQALDFGNRAPAGDNGPLLVLPAALDEAGAR